MRDFRDAKAGALTRPVPDVAEHRLVPGCARDSWRGRAAESQEASSGGSQYLTRSMMPSARATR